MKSNRTLLSYLVFYVLFSPDTWRILAGLAAALLMGPRLTAGKTSGPFGEVIIWVMLLALGYALSAPLGKLISDKLTAMVRRASR